MTHPQRTLFVLGQGRSGTAFLASLLDLDPRARVRHEAWRWDPHILGLSRSGRFEAVVEAMLEERFDALLREAGSVDLYGEVNSYLRYNVEWLRRRFDPVLVHVVRDGRDFVRSAWIREVLQPGQPQLPIVPEDGDPDAARWGAFSRFERICWIWKHTNEHLGARIERRVRLEDLVASYATLRDSILEPVGLEVSEAAWRTEVARPRNTSREFRIRQRLRGWFAGRGSSPEAAPLPPWRDWDDERTERFWEICGPTMERFGYRRDGS